MSVAVGVDGPTSKTVPKISTTLRPLVSVCTPSPMHMIEGPFGTDRPPHPPQDGLPKSLCGLETSKQNRRRSIRQSRETSERDTRV